MIFSLATGSVAIFWCYWASISSRMHFTFKVFLFFVWKSCYVNSSCVLIWEVLLAFHVRRIIIQNRIYLLISSGSRDDSAGTEEKKSHQFITTFSHGTDFIENDMCGEVELRKKAAHTPGFQQPRLIPLSDDPLGSQWPICGKHWATD